MRAPHTGVDRASSVFRMYVGGNEFFIPTT